jgi:regulator of sigma E protease
VLLTLAAVIVVLGVLIFVHEMGHFLAAKAVGIQVLRFSLGFGRPVLAWQRGETQYWISWIPLGGYVKMAGLEEEPLAGRIEGGRASVPVDPARAFDRQPLWKRTVVIVAGVAMNVLFAFAVYAGIAGTVGSPELASTAIDSVTARALPPGAEALASLRFGDRILRVNGDTIRSWNALLDHLLTGPPEWRIEVAGRPEPLRVRLRDGGLAARQALAQALVRLDPPRLGILEPGRPAIRAGLKPGDVLLRADGDTLRSWSDVLHAVWRSPGRPLRLDVWREGQVLQITVVPEPRTETDPASPRPRLYGAIGAGQDPPTIHVREPLGRAVVAGFTETRARALLVLGFVKGLVLGRVSPREVGGPLLVGQISGQVARLGLDWFLTFMAFFSINLAVLNLLPIPILDGGQLMFLIAEAVRRKPLSAELRTRLTQLGFVLLLGIMILALTNDALRVLPR